MRDGSVLVGARHASPILVLFLQLSERSVDRPVLIQGQRNVLIRKVPPDPLEDDLIAADPALALVIGEGIANRRLGALEYDLRSRSAVRHLIAALELSSAARKARLRSDARFGHLLRRRNGHEAELLRI